MVFAAVTALSIMVLAILSLASVFVQDSMKVLPCGVQALASPSDWWSLDVVRSLFPRLLQSGRGVDSSAACCESLALLVLWC